jgi:hypothetical protein
MNNLPHRRQPLQMPTTNADNAGNCWPTTSTSVVHPNFPSARRETALHRSPVHQLTCNVDVYSDASCPAAPCTSYDSAATMSLHHAVSSPVSRGVETNDEFRASPLAIAVANLNGVIGRCGGNSAVGPSSYDSYV